MALLHHVTLAIHDFQETLSRARDKGGTLVLNRLAPTLHYPSNHLARISLMASTYPQGKLGDAEKHMDIGSVVTISALIRSSVIPVILSIHTKNTINPFPSETT